MVLTQFVYIPTFGFDISNFHVRVVKSWLENKFNIHIPTEQTQKTPSFLAEQYTEEMRQGVQ